jgi:hypothetical protein
MIEAWVVGRNYGSKGACFSVWMSFRKHKWKRSVICGKLTSNQVEMKGVEFVIKSILPEFHNCEIRINVDGRYAPMMFEKEEGEWKRGSRKNAELVEEIRELTEGFKDISIVRAEDNSIFKQLRDINEKTILTREEIKQKEGT